MRTLIAVVFCLVFFATVLQQPIRGLVVPLSAAQPADFLRGCTLPRLQDGEMIDVGQALASNDDGLTLLVLGSHCADFNTIEYGQRVRAYWERLTEESGITRCLYVMNGSAESCATLANLLDLPLEIEILFDPSGEAGRLFGVSRGWQPNNKGIPAWLKVTVVGLGFGPPWGTLPAILPGYLGDPRGNRYWIEESLKQGQLLGRWPPILKLDDNGAIVSSKFDNFPLLSEWGRRPFELATLRLQNLVGIQIKYWGDLKPLDYRCLTQLGGCTVTAPGGRALYSWIDRGLCDVPDIEDMLAEVTVNSKWDY